MAYTSIHVARNTTAHELVKLVLENYGKDESPDNFLVRESSANLEGESVSILRGFSLGVKIENYSSKRTPNCAMTKQANYGGWYFSSIRLVGQMVKTHLLSSGHKILVVSKFHSRSLLCCNVSPLVKR